MDSISTTPSPSVAVGSSSLWRLTERRNRKSGSGNIFSSVNLQQLQRLFTAAGDQDAQQRAQLVWGHRDEAELAQALIALRSRVHKRELRTNDALGSHWLRSFNQLSLSYLGFKRTLQADIVKMMVRSWILKLKHQDVQSPGGTPYLE
ncbi:arginine vasopressin-induced protein 1-like isoform X2 [Cyprinodon tularosa]|uniref:arginine vasopressin-induced protein 1-like isoform X2 n=1 Tax=Cyprinodon tularosa TaxID=77115 RepID=UPI0018E1FE64|nr:arginine vasopressin-induced protein 1-like isoform X2 [Cyprinodon tularosa]